MNQIAVWPIFKRTLDEWSEDKAPKMAASLSFYTATSIAPLAVALVGIGTLVAKNKFSPKQIHDTLAGFTDPHVADALDATLNSPAATHAGIVATIVGISVALFSASGVFGELQDSLNTIWEVKPKPNRGIWGIVHDRFLTLSMVLGIAFLLLVSTVLTSVIAGLSGSFFGGFLGTAAVGKAIIMLATFFITLGVVTVLFAAMFKFLPDVIIAWRDVWLGAFLTAILFQIGKEGLGLYMGYAAGSAAGALAAIVVMLVWVNYSAQILFFGAEFTQVYANQYGSRVLPAANAMPLTEEMRQQAGIAHAPDSPSHPDNIAADHQPPPQRRPAPVVVASTAGRGVVLGGLPVAVGLVLGRIAWHRYKAAHIHGDEIRADWQTAARKWKRLAKLFVSTSADRFAMTHGPSGRTGPTWSDLAPDDVRRP
jgi:membrane protein